MESIILKVVLVLGIIIAGGFLLFFMADILMAIFNGKKDDKIVKTNEKEEVKKVEEQLAESKIDENEATALVNGAVVEAYNPEEGQEEQPAEEVEEETEETDEAEEGEEEEEPQDRDAYIEARRAALMERLAKMNDEEDSEEEEEESEETDEAEEGEEEEESEEESEEETEDVVDLDQDESETNEELEETRSELEKERAKTEALQAELADARRAKTGSVAYLTEEEYEDRLAVLNERLKLNEKELRACKKEYLPLRKVQKTLENDERKLRRKEALVAKQKVVLYGVNNYEDIDEEKAKKLAEDLDLLDGLKLSVEHCQEVMTKNAERYPLLERIYNVLTAQNEQIKADIERAEKELADLKGKKN